MLEGKTKIGLIISFAVMIILGLIFMGVVADEVTRTQQTKTVINETIVGRTDANVSLSQDDLISVTAAFNSSTKAIVENTDYEVFLPQGYIHILSTQLNNTNYNLTFGYYPTDYVKDNTSRNITALIILLFAIGILVIGAFYVKRFSDDIF